MPISLPLLVGISLASVAPLFLVGADSQSSSSHSGNYTSNSASRGAGTDFDNRSIVLNGNRVFILREFEQDNEESIYHDNDDQDRYVVSQNEGHPNPHIDTGGDFYGVVDLDALRDEEIPGHFVRVRGELVILDNTSMSLSNFDWIKNFLKVAEFRAPEYNVYLLNPSERELFINNFPTRSITDLRNVLNSKFKISFVNATKGEKFTQAKMIEKQRAYVFLSLVKALQKRLNRKDVPDWIDYNEYDGIPFISEEDIECFSRNLSKIGASWEWKDAFKKAFEPDNVYVSNDGYLERQTLWNNGSHLADELSQKDRSELIDRIKDLNYQYSDVVADGSRTPHERFIAQKRIIRLEELVESLNTFISDDRAPNSFGNMPIYDIDFHTYYSDEQFNADLLRNKDTIKEHWRDLIKSLFTKKWNNKWYEEGQQIEEHLYNNEEISALIEKWCQLDSYDQLNACINKHVQETLSRMTDGYCYEHKKRMEARLDNLKEFLITLDDEVSQNNTPWMCHETFDLNIFYEISDDKPENEDNSVKVDDWKQLLKECAKTKKDGEFLFSSQQRGKILNITSNGNASEALGSFNINTILGNDNSQNKVRCWTLLSDVRNKLQKLSNALKEGNNQAVGRNIDKKVLDIVEACTKTTINAKELFTRAEKEKILKLVEKSKSETDVYEKIKNSVKALSSGLHFNIKEHEINDVISKLKPICEDLKEKRYIENLLRQNALKKGFIFSDAERVRKRSGLNDLSLQEKSSCIKAMNAIDGLELDMGCTLKDLANSKDLIEIENDFRKMVIECRNEGLDDVNNATNKSFNEKRLEITKKYFAKFDGNKVDSIKNILALNRVYSLLLFLFKDNNAIKCDKKDIKAYFENNVGQEDKSLINDILKKYPNIMKVISNWLVISENILTKDGIINDRYTSLFNSDEIIRGDAYDEVVNIDNLPSFIRYHGYEINKIDGIICKCFLDDRFKKEQEFNHEQRNEKFFTWRQIVNSVYGGLDIPFCEYLHGKNTSLYDENGLYSCKENYFGIASLAKILSLLDNNACMRSNDDLFINTRNELTLNLINIFGMGAGCFYRRFKYTNDEFFTSTRAMSNTEANAFYGLCSKSKVTDFLHPQLKIAFSTFIKGLAFKNILVDEDLLEKLSEAYSSYEKYVMSKNVVPESLPVWMKKENIALISRDLLENAKVISRTHSDNGNQDYSERMSNISKRLVELKKCYDYALTNKNYQQDDEQLSILDDNEDNSNINQHGEDDKVIENELEEQSDEDLDVEDTPEWQAIKAPENASEWEKTFYNVFKSKNSQGEHIFELNSLAKIKLTNDIPTMKKWEDIETELRSLIFGIYNWSRFGSENEKQRAKEQIEKIEELVVKLNKLIKAKKAPQGFEGKPDHDDWDCVEDDDVGEQEQLNNFVFNNWSEVVIPNNADDWTKEFYKAFLLTDDNNVHIFDIKSDVDLIRDFPKIRKSNELYEELCKVTDRMYKVEEDYKINMKAQAIESLVRTLSVLQIIGKGQEGFEGNVDLKGFHDWQRGIIQNNDNNPKVEIDDEQDRIYNNEVNKDFEMMENQEH